MNSFYYAPSLDLGFVCSITDQGTSPGFAFGLALGNFEFRPTTKFGIAVNLLTFEYNMRKMKGVKEKVNGINFSLGVSPTLGLKYYF